MIVYYLNLFKRYFVFVMYISIRNRIEMNMWNSSSYVYLVGLSQVKYKYKYKKKHQTSSSTARMQFATDLADRHLEMHQCKRRGCCCKSFCHIYNLQVVFTPKSSNRVPFQV